MAVSKCHRTKDGKDPCSGSNLYGRIETRELHSWPEILEAHRKLTERKNTEWIFRGQKCCAWGLRTELERSIEKYGVVGKDARRIEGGLIRLFKRQFRQYGTGTPAEDDYMEWLALMQHHGGPTRLLDWTYSFFVALFFAIEQTDGPCAVWALAIDRIEEWIKKKHPDVWGRIGTDGSDPNARRFETFKEVFLAKKRFVINMNSYNQNERLVIQQGTFLCPGDIVCSFEDNLIALAGRESFDDGLIKFVISNAPTNKKDILKGLLRMNINYATLFPGLDGFARSLKTRLSFPQVLNPDPDWLSWISKKT